jgi:hypothetical protein
LYARRYNKVLSSHDSNGTNPIPTGFQCPFGTMFDVPFDYGYGQHVWNNPPDTPQALVWVMVDEVRAPAERGEYVLRWRWDVEQVRCDSLPTKCGSLPTKCGSLPSNDSVGRRAEPAGMDALRGRDRGVRQAPPV